MFSYPQVIIAAIFGKLKNNKELNKYFWVFVTGLILLLCLLTYNAYVSLHFYDHLVTQFIPWPNQILAIGITILLALVIFHLLNCVGGTLLTLNRESYQQAKSPLFILSLCLLIILLPIDINANLKGVSYLLKEVTSSPVADTPLTVFERINATINQKEVQLEKLLSGQVGGYGWQADSIFSLNQSGKEFQRALSAEIADLREQQSFLVTAEQKKTITRLEEDNAVRQEKTRYHHALVWLAYPLTFLLCLFCKYYTTLAQQHVDSVTPNTSTRQEKGNAEANTLAIGSLAGMIPLSSLPAKDSALLTKWREAVTLILAGSTNKEVIQRYAGPEGSIGGTTIQKLKTILRAHGLLAQYQPKQ